MSKRGFTLVEVLVALAVLMIALGVSVYLFKSALAGIKRSYELTDTYFKAQAEAEELRGVPFDSLLSLSGTRFADGKGKIAVTPVQSDLLEITLEIPPYKLTTMRSRY